MDEQKSATSPAYVGAVVGLLVLGLFITLFEGHRLNGTDGVIASLTVLAIGSIFGALAVNTGLAGVLENLRHPSPKTRRWITLAIIPITAAFLVLVNKWIGRSLLPFWHDDQMHATQARMFAEGHLVMPQHPLADFFETFHVFVKPVYAGIHFLGTTLLNGPGLWAGFPTYVVPLLAASVGAALAYRIITELLDGVFGLMSVLILWSLGYYQFLGPRMTSHGAMLMIGLLSVWAWLKWRQNPLWRWAIIYGLLAGLGLITRPLDAMAYLLPTGLAMLFSPAGPPWRNRLAKAAVAAACMLPFFAIQLKFDQLVTGRWLYSPYQYYNDLNYPGINFDLRNETRPSSEFADTPSQLLQKRSYYNDWLLNFVRNAQSETIWKRLWEQRLSVTLQMATPGILFFLFAPLGLLGLRTGPRIVFVSIAALYLLLYVPHYFFLPHYPVIIAPSVALLVFLGLRSLAEAVPKRAKTIEGCGLFTMLLSCIMVMPFLNPPDATLSVEMHDAAFANEKLPALVQKPAIVLFRYVPGVNFHDEPVYNFERAWPDDGQIIRAQDLGARNGELFRYYAERQPNRTVYLYDRSKRRLVRLGNVKELAVEQTDTKSPATMPQE